MNQAQFTPFDCLAILGVGLMGGSLGLAVKKHGLAKRVLGIDAKAAILAQAQKRGAIDEGATDLSEALKEADFIVLAAPVSVIPSLLERIAPEVRPNALITDLGSTKVRIVEIGTRLFGTRFVGGHPMAGSEESGIKAAQPDLFTGAAWAVVRLQPFDLAQDPEAARLAAFVTALGGRPIPLEAALHDHLVALVSHLPHVLSFAFAQTIASSAEAEQARAMAGGSYRDLIRVSNADPALWRDILHENRSALLAALTAYETRLQALKSALLSDDPQTLLAELKTFSPKSA